LSGDTGFKYQEWSLMPWGVRTCRNTIILIIRSAYQLWYTALFMSAAASRYKANHAEEGETANGADMGPPMGH
jgi:hypothetical protein